MGSITASTSNKVFLQGRRDTWLRSVREPVQGVLHCIQYTVLLPQVPEKLKFAHRHQGTDGQVATNAAFDGIRFVFQADDFLPQFFEGLALFGYIAFDSLLKGPRALIDLFGMLLKAFKGRSQKHGSKRKAHGTSYIVPGTQP
ncbi:MAG: hypothetical protein P8X95_20550 [Anaerolineales bacterium]